MDYITNFLSRIHWEELCLLALAIAIITLIVKIVEYVAGRIAALYPKKRMIILGWIPLFGFASYFIGIIAAFDVIIHPP
jgi:hypothetical protein